MMVPNHQYRTSPDIAGIVIAGVLLLLSAVVWWDMNSLGVAATYGIGPKAMPGVVSAGLAILAAANLVQALRGELPHRETGNPRAILLILGGLVALMTLIGIGGGFILGTAILFAATSRAFGRNAFLIDLAIGFILAVVIYVLFAKLLALSLPMGPLEHLI
ncbi:tripartite tricarboxylate transporter TctB family protein [Microvirga massiliensis]|uniref:tripartite tricarboxylate transporter TctB family protein n=1 Tax=Microvirga massiliensis TaxID=1033741 RepID=UPI000A8A58FA|nr:tripartite tricarboxylate transporter TctB family protein [Microvirga massiliensis]